MVTFGGTDRSYCPFKQEVEGLESTSKLPKLLSIRELVDHGMNISTKVGNVHTLVRFADTQCRVSRLSQRDGPPAIAKD